MLRPALIGERCRTQTVRDGSTCHRRSVAVRSFLLYDFVLRYWKVEVDIHSLTKDAFCETSGGRRGAMTCVELYAA